MHLDLLAFILIPHLLHQFERMFNILWRFVSFSASKTRSSANSNDDIIASLQWTPNPTEFISSTRSFINVENSEGERMQPCLTPFWISNQSVSLLLTLTALSTFSYKDLIRSKKGPLIPNLCSILCQSATLLTESNAFLKSTKQAKVSCHCEYNHDCQ